MNTIEYTDLLELLENKYPSLSDTGDPDEYRMDCPFCIPMDTGRHLYINIEKASLNLSCWMCHKCGAKGGVSNLLDDKQFVPVTLPIKKRIRKKKIFLPGNMVRADECGKAMQYLASRGVTDIDKWKIGYCNDGWYAKRLIFPVYNYSNELKGFVARAIDGRKPKYKYPLGMKTSELLYNIVALADDKEGPILVAEGIFDVIKLSNAGYNCVGLLGSSLSEEQFKMLKGWWEFILILDRDAVLKADVIARRLTALGKVRMVYLKDDKDPGDMNSEEIHKVVDSAEEYSPLGSLDASIKVCL